MGSIISSTCLFAQSEEMHLACRDLNTIFAGSYRFHVNNEQQLEVEFYNESGNYRQDMVYLDFLDPEHVTYNSDEKAVSIRCAEDGEKCIDKEIYKLDVVRHSSRINMKQPDMAQAERSIELIKQIILGHQANEAAMNEKKGEVRRGKGETRKRK